MVTNRSETTKKFSLGLNSKNSTKENWKSLVRESQIYLGIKICLPKHLLFKIIHAVLAIKFYFLFHFLHIVTVQSELIHTNTVLPTPIMMLYGLQGLM